MFFQRSTRNNRTVEYLPLTNEAVAIRILLNGRLISQYPLTLYDLQNFFNECEKVSFLLVFSVQ